MNDNDQRDLTIFEAIARSVAEVVTEPQLHEIFLKAEARLPIGLQGHDWNNVQMFLVALYGHHRHASSLTSSK